MSTAALKTSTDQGSGFAALLSRHPDIVVLVLAFPVFVFAQLPLVAYFGAAAIWLVQAVVQAVVDRKLRGSTNARQVLALTMGTAIARAFFSAAGVLAIGVAYGDEAGLASVLFIFTLFTVYLVGKFITHALNAVDEGESV